MDRDLKEAISSVKRRYYDRALQHAAGRAELRSLEQQVRMDPSLTQSDKNLLLRTVARVAHLGLEP